MFDTTIVVVGNVLSTPEWRRTANSNRLVANFKIVSTARRYDRETGRWADGHSFRIRVVCWRRLAEGVAASLSVGDPVVVTGRLYTRDWRDSDGQSRVTYEMEAVAIGHDLSRGKARFYRFRPGATSAVETPEAQSRVRGEHTFPVPEDETPVLFGEGLPDEADEPVFIDVPPRGAVPQSGGTIEPSDSDFLAPRLFPAESSSLGIVSEPPATFSAVPTAGADPADSGSSPEAGGSGSEGDGASSTNGGPGSEVSGDNGSDVKVSGGPDSEGSTDSGSDGEGSDGEGGGSSGGGTDGGSEGDGTDGGDSEDGDPDDGELDDDSDAATGSARSRTRNPHTPAPRRPTRNRNSRRQPVPA
jgi:single-strand DNA-binding protein